MPAAEPAQAWRGLALPWLAGLGCPAGMGKKQHHHHHHLQGHARPRQATPAPPASVDVDRPGRRLPASTSTTTPSTTTRPISLPLSLNRRHHATVCASRRTTIYRVHSRIRRRRHHPRPPSFPHPASAIANLPGIPAIVIPPRAAPAAAPPGPGIKVAVAPGMRPPTSSSPNDIDATRPNASTSPQSTASPPASLVHRPLAALVMAADETRDSRASSSSNSPAPPDNEESDFYLGANDSQTSLGVVPNMQDMQVNDLECTSTIAALPSEILISIFSRLSDASDLFRAMLVCKRWSRNVVEILWHRPACSSWKKHHAICSTLGQQQPHFAYSDFVKRLNLAALADHVSDGSVQPLAVCSRVERLTLTNCKHLTDSGLIPLVTNNHHLLALDISGDENITENTINAIAENCRRLQGLNMTSCKNVSNESLQKLAENCRYIKRVSLACRVHDLFRRRDLTTDACPYSSNSTSVLKSTTMRYLPLLGTAQTYSRSICTTAWPLATSPSPRLWPGANLCGS